MQHFISELRKYNQPMPKSHHRCQFGSLVAKHQGQHHVLSGLMQEEEQQHKLLYNGSLQFLTGDRNINIWQMVLDPIFSQVCLLKFARMAIKTHLSNFQDTVTSTGLRPPIYSTSASKQPANHFTTSRSSDELVISREWVLHYY